MRFSRDFSLATSSSEEWKTDKTLLLGTAYTTLLIYNSIQHTASAPILSDVSSLEEA